MGRRRYRIGAAEAAALRIIAMGGCVRESAWVAAQELVARCRAERAAAGDVFAGSIRRDLGSEKENLGRASTASGPRLTLSANGGRSVGGTCGQRVGGASSVHTLSIGSVHTVPQASSTVPAASDAPQTASGGAA